MQVIEAVKLAKELRPDLDLEGPLQYDAAVDPSVAKTKVSISQALQPQGRVLKVCSTSCRRCM